MKLGLGRPAARARGFLDELPAHSRPAVNHEWTLRRPETVLCQVSDDRQSSQRPRVCIGPARWALSTATLTGSEAATRQRERRCGSTANVNRRRPAPARRGRPRPGGSGRQLETASPRRGSSLPREPFNLLVVESRPTSPARPGPLPRGRGRDARLECARASGWSTVLWPIPADRSSG